LKISWKILETPGNLEMPESAGKCWKMLENAGKCWKMLENKAKRDDDKQLIKKGS